MDFAFNKSVTKEPRRRDTFFEAYFLQLKAAELLSRSPPEYSLDNMTTDERETCADESDVYKKKKKKHFVVPVHPPPPPSGTAVEKRAVRCAQQVPANYTQTLFNKPKNAPFFFLRLR